MFPAGEPDPGSWERPAQGNCERPPGTPRQGPAGRANGVASPGSAAGRRDPGEIQGTSSCLVSRFPFGGLNLLFSEECATWKDKKVPPPCGTRHQLLFPVAGPQNPPPPALRRSAWIHFVDTQFSAALLVPLLGDR